MVRLNASFLLTEQLLLSAGFSYRRGDFVSNAQGSRFRVLAENDIGAVARDQVFGGWVYRINGNGYEPFLRLNYALSDRWSIDLGYRFRYGEGGGLDYRNHVVSGVVVFRYCSGRAMIEPSPERTAGTRRLRTKALALAVLLMCGLLAPTRSASERLVATVQNEQGETVQDAVVYALPLDADGKLLPPPEPIQIDQVNKEFVPYVTAVSVGTRVNFPNRDQIRHHVYSFSEAKRFEIPLYKGSPAKLVEFDKSGDVALGCNIHDWMKAYVFVAQTPYFAVTDREGAARIELPAGDYQVKVWHPELKGEPEATALHHRVAAGEESALRFSIEQKHLWKPRRAPSMGDRGYR